MCKQALLPSTADRSRTQCVGMHCGRLPGDDTDLRRIAELGKEVLIFPPKAECAYIDDADSGHCIANGCEMSAVELTVHQEGFSPARNAMLNGRVIGVASLTTCTEQNVSPLL